MSSNIIDFIGVYNNVYPEGFCQHLVSEMERLIDYGVVKTRQQNSDSTKQEKDDFSWAYNGKNFNFDPFEFNENKIDTTDLFFEGLQRCYDEYTDAFPNLKDIKMRCNTLKLQKTIKGGGYHVWHSEQGNNEQGNRGLVYSLYLNTLPPEGCGETEFLHQQRRVQPIENTMVLWPAGFTHVHRGNPVHGETAKYIATGWFYHE
jgi:hypothetical protein